MIADNEQSIYDVILQEFGTLDEAATMLADNDLSFNSKLSSGQELVINNTGVGDNRIKNFVILKNKRFNNFQGSFIPPLFGGDYDVSYSPDYY